MTHWTVSVLSLAAALAAAVLLSLRSPHRPVALTLAWGLVVDLVVGVPIKDADGHVIGGWGLAFYLGTHKPWDGTRLALYHASNALVTSWPLAVAALAWWALAPAHRRRVLPALLLIGVAANALLVRGPLEKHRIQAVILAVEIAAVALGFVAGVVGWSGPRWRAPQGVAVALVGVELVLVLAGPYRYSVFERWDLAQICYTLTFAALAIAQGIVWRRLRPSGQDPSP